MQGIVSKSTGSWYKVIVNGEEVDARMRGKIRIRGLKSTNPVAVGDQVILEEVDGEYHIADILDRKNCIVRKSNKLSKQYQLIAANIDLAVLVITPGQPYTPMGFIDRYLVTAEAYHIPVVLLLNKKDLQGDKIESYRQQLFERYTSIGYPCHLVSFLDEDDLTLVSKLMQGKTCLIGGNSGVGKSTLINRLDPNIQQKTGAISSSYQKGTHTTTFAQMFPLNEDTFLIDTPGIKDFGLVHLDKFNLSHYFPEMKARSSDCKFNNCLHIEEPQCAVVEALEKGEIAESRYLNYLGMLDEIDANKNV